MNEEQIRAIQDMSLSVTLLRPDLNIIPDTEDYPWVIREFQKKLQAMEHRNELLLPDVRKNNESIAVFSDYGGESADSQYNTYSFLVCAWNQTGLFKSQMDIIRKDAGLNNPFKEISFKDFRYGPIKRALPKYLSALSNLVNGYLLTVVVSKDVPSIFGGSNKKIARRQLSYSLAEMGLGNWKPDVAEKLLRVAHFSAYLVALLSRPGHKVFWMSDNDSIAATDEQHKHTLQVFSNILQRYCKHELPVIGGSTPFNKEGEDHGTLDLLSAADIVAGSVEHYLTRSKLSGDELDIKEEANQVLMWLTGQGVMLKRHTMFIRMEGKALACGTSVFSLKEPDPSATVIPVVLG